MFFFAANFTFAPQEAQSASLLETIKEVASWALGDGGIRYCAKKIGCDDFEDVSVVDSVSGVFSNDKKSRICAASAVVKNIARVIGYLEGGPLGYVVTNIGANAFECLMIYLKSEGAKKKRDKYEVCLNTSDAGHPLPYTDAQIASLLRKIGIYPDLEIIQRYYNKICIHNKETDQYSFYSDGDYKDDVYVSHMDGYVYVLCASIIDACPCVFNLNKGLTTEPEYKKDDNGVAIMEDGKLVYEGDQEDFHNRYARHCRILRYKDLYEQTNDLPTVFDESCYDLHGYSKRGGASITGAMVQCIEGTARNIFEKPLVNRIVTGNNNIQSTTYGYQKDKSYISSKIVSIKNVLNDRDIDKIAQGLDIPLTTDEKSQILELLKEAWYNVISTDIQYVCTTGDKYNAKQRNVSLFTKYLDKPIEEATQVCCPKGGANYSHCYGNKIDFSDLDLFNGEADNYDIISQDKDVNTLTLYEISKQLQILESLVDKIQEKADTFTTGINSLMPDPDENTDLSTYLMTLFDLFRNKIKVLALIAITFWFFMIGWKMINGDFAEFKIDEISMLVIKLSMSFFLIFSDVAKNYIFYFAINTADGIGMAIQGIFLSLRDSSDNYFNKTCDYRNTIPFTAKSITETNTAERTEKGSKIIKIDDKEYTIKTYNFQCPYAIDSKSCTQYDSMDSSVCVQMNCTHTKKVCEEDNGDNGNSGYSLHCSLYYPNILTGKESDKICVRGSCKYDLSTFIAMPSFERPYKITKYFNRKTSSWEEFRPYCHEKGGEETSNVTLSKKMFSATLGTYVYVCPNSRLEMDDGYRIKDLYQKGVIDDDTIIYMKSLLTEDERRGLTADAEIKAKLLDKNIVVRTAAATISAAGNVYDYNFVDEGRTTEGQMRYSYRKFLQSKIDAMNKNSDYPILSVNGLTRDYTTLAFWDSMDCKVIQYLTFGIGQNNSLMDDADTLVESIKNGDGEGIIDALGNGLWEAIKLCFIGFPAGFVACFLCLFVGLTLFAMVARACQHYCVCIFNLIVIMYISPFVFTLYLFDQTKGVFKPWKEELIKNTCGACIPFVTVSLFLLVIDYFFFGDEAKYVSEQMFLSDGNIDTSCYEDNLSDAPIACLFVRLTKQFSLLGNIIDLFTGGSVSMFESQTFKMAWYLVLKLLVAVVVIFILDKTYDIIEEKIYSLFGGAPDTDIGVGWSGSVSENAGMMKMGKMAWSGAVTYLKAPVKITKQVYNTTKNMVTNIINKISRTFG